MWRLCFCPCLVLLPWRPLILAFVLIHLMHFIYFLFLLIYLCLDLLLNCLTFLFYFIAFVCNYYYYLLHSSFLLGLFSRPLLCRMPWTESYKSSKKLSGANQLSTGGWWRRRVFGCTINQLHSTFLTTKISLYLLHH